MKDKTIRILLIEDDHEIILPGLSSRFRPSRDHIEFIGSTGTVDEAVRKFKASAFDIIFLDLYIPGSFPLDNIKKVKEIFPGKPVIIYTTEQRSAWMRKTYTAGVKAYLTKKDDKATIKQAIIQVINGHSFFCGLTDDMEDKKFSKSLQDPENTISEVEKNIVTGLCKGLSLRDIAKQLNCKVYQVEKILSRLRKEHDARNNTHLTHILTDKAII
jgi:DNA-binding NarL/FixJ family response regulator